MIARIKNKLRTIKRRLNFRWQNLDDRPGDRWESTGNIWRHGRAWIRPFGEGTPEFRIEWCFFDEYKFRHLVFELDPSEGEITLGTALHPVAVWWAITDIGRYLKELGPWDDPGGFKGWQKVLKVSYHDHSFFWTFWYDDNHWSSEMPKWRSGSFDVADFLFGQMDYTEERIKPPTHVKIPMPERNYAGIVTLNRATWKRPRLPWNSHQVIRANINMENDPIPHPGKGTTSYNCGETALQSMTVKARTIAEAIGLTTKSVMSDRERYGSITWRPSEDHRPKRIQEKCPILEKRGSHGA